MSTTTKTALVALIIAALTSPALAKSAPKSEGAYGGYKIFGGVNVKEQNPAFDREKSSL